MFDTESLTEEKERSLESETTGRVLVVCHSPELNLYVQKGVALGNLESSTVTRLEEARAILAEDSGFGAVLIELEDPLAPGDDELLERFCGDFSSIPVVGLAPKPSPELVRDVMTRGARDFLTNPFDSRSLARSLSDAIADAASPAGGARPSRPGDGEESTERRRRGGLRGPREWKEPSGRSKPASVILTENSQMQRILDIVDRVAPTDSTVLIEGDSGTGKELVAKRIHHLSERASGPFVEVHCGAIPPSLLESQLFGHEKGSFTGAVSRQVGLFEISHKGTIFLDEIAEMNLEMQVKLLRVLQERSFRRIGGKNNVHVDVRVVAATNRDLKTEVEANRFRADLFYRINVISLKLPPLADRLEDIPKLVEFFADRFQRDKHLPRKSFHPETIQRFQTMRWVGNVRELENVIERLLLLSPGEVVLPEDLEESDADLEPASDSPFDVNLTLDDIKKIHIMNVLRANSGNKMKSARILGINIKTLYNLIQRLSIPTQ